MNKVKQIPMPVRYDTDLALEAMSSASQTIHMELAEVRENVRTRCVGDVNEVEDDPADEVGSSKRVERARAQVGNVPCNL
jgi:hypothetical protein